jgi:hypothetical protein
MYTTNSDDEEIDYSSSITYTATTVATLPSSYVDVSATNE